MISLVECLDLIKELTGKGQKITFEKVRPGDLFYFVCDIAKARKNLKWQPKISNKDGVKRLVDWVTENKKMFGG